MANLNYRGAAAARELEELRRYNGFLLQERGKEFGLPVTFGVLTCDTVEQAIERSGTKAGNKGVDAALSAIEMVNLLRQLNA